MRETNRIPGTRGLTLMEVLIALVILAIVTTVFMRTSNMSIRNTGRSMDWQLETIVVEKTIENLRRCTSPGHLRGLDSIGEDRTGNVPVSVRVHGSAPPAGTCTGFPCDSLAQVTVVAQRTSYPDSLSVTTFLFAKRP
jgi:prepilin-type N-terminal cleavage/methylation domain-containing protein